jgi:2-desacetyl-2-hydroxyethyl bacteriochlorophyllide A dehydrogenase
VLAIRKVAPTSGIQVVDVPEPTLEGPDNVIVKVSHAGICGTDLHIDHWTTSYHFLAPSLPVTIGHEFSGEVCQVGPGVNNLAVGDRVTVRPSTVCGKCSTCVSGLFDACLNRRGIGVVRNGGFAQMVAVPARNCVRLPAELDLRLAALAEPMTVSYEAVRTAEVGQGSRVLIVGPGNIGQGIALFCKEFGAAEIVIAGYCDQLRFSVLRSIGFEQLIETESSPLFDATQALKTADQFDVVIEASGAGSVIAPSLSMLKPKGILVICGIHKEPVQIDLTQLVRKQHQIRGSYRTEEKNWETVLQFMSRNQAALKKMVTHEFPLEQAQKGFDFAHKKMATKVLLRA